jgi:chaperonin GroEL
MNIIKTDKAIEGIMEGVEIATDLIRPTYGASGSNVIIESKLRPYHLIANDAWTIIKGIELDDPAQRIGLQFVKELCERQDKISGDSRKTTILLLSELLKLGYKIDMDKIKLKQELDKFIPIIESKIDNLTKQIGVDEVYNVTKTASESETTALLLSDIYYHTGKDCIIQVEGSGTYETSYRIINGVRFDMAGYLSPYMNYDDPIKAIYENPLILVTKKKIVTDEDINPLLKQLELDNKKDLVIFAQDMDSNVASMLIDLHKSHRFNICIIKAPSLWRDFYFEDFAKCVGATIISDETGLNSFKNLPISVLGTCEKIIVDADETIIIGHKPIEEHIEQLRAKGDDDSKLRLNWLTNKTCIIKLGANSETDLSYKLLKTRDAIRSCELALKYGVVQGGGLCLYGVSLSLDNTITGNLLTSVLQAPHNQIKANGIDFIEDTIVDSAAIIKNAIRNAVGIASTILTASSIVYLQKEKVEVKKNPFE